MNASNFVAFVAYSSLLVAQAALAEQAATENSPSPEKQEIPADCAALEQKIMQGTELSESERSSYAACLSKDPAWPVYYAVNPPLLDPMDWFFRRDV